MAERRRPQLSAGDQAQRRVDGTHGERLEREVGPQVGPTGCGCGDAVRQDLAVEVIDEQADIPYMAVPPVVRGPTLPDERRPPGRFFAGCGNRRLCPG